MNSSKIISLMITAFAIATSSAGAKELELKIYDKVSRKNLRTTVNSITGQFRVDVTQLFDPQYKTEKEPTAICNVIKDVLKSDPDAPADALKSSPYPAVTWQVFKDFRDLDHLKTQIRRQLTKQGHNPTHLTNLTSASAEELTVRKVTWKHDALSATNLELANAADQELKRMFNGDFNEIHNNGRFTAQTNFSFLYCDLVQRNLEIEFSIKGQQNDYFDANIDPVSAIFTKSDILSFSQQLYLKISEIQKSATRSTSTLSALNKSKILSVAHLANLIYSQNIDINSLDKGELIDLAQGLIDPIKGLPKQITQEQAAIIETSLFRGNYSQINEKPFHLNGQF